LISTSQAFAELPALYYPHLAGLADAVLREWPEHRAFLSKRFRDSSPELNHIAERMAQVILAGPSADALGQYCRDYRNTCELIIAEELYFRRSGRYRNTSFKEVRHQIYDNPAVMKPYLNGLLLAQPLWLNHVCVHAAFEAFLDGLADGVTLAEVGPGHGLLLCTAARRSHIHRLIGWDISASSLDAARRTLAAAGLGDRVTLEQVDVRDIDGAAEAIDTCVISEVLEHLEDPGETLRGLWRRLRPGGRIFINVPINSPAPDHIYLWTSPEEFTEFVAGSNFSVEAVKLFPATGYELESALRRRLTISVVVCGARL